jgi:ATP-dependent Clp protease ATP-binding subunit ClpC
MEDELHRRVIGQDQAIKALSQAIRRTRAGLKDPKRPGGSFIFAGPSGVGKTELSRTLASFLFGDETALIQLDMSEYSERHTASRLFGAPPGYVGYEKGGLLTEAIMKQSHAILLLDEIEKAHPDIFNLLLQVMDDGRLTDNNGRTADCRNLILIMTSNVGADQLDKASFGFLHADDRASGVKKALDQTFKPEFRNRLDAVVPFSPMSREMMPKIVDKAIFALEALLDQKQLHLRLTQAARDWLADKGFDPKMGARPLERVIETHLKRPLADVILFGDLDKHSRLLADVSDSADELIIRIEALHTDSSVKHSLEVLC